VKKRFESEKQVVDYLKNHGFELVKDSKIIKATKTIGIHTMGIVDYLTSNYKYLVVW